MSEQKRFKAFRSELNESEYKETLTGYPNRGIDTDVGAANANLLMKVNAVLNSLNRFTHQHANDALVKIRTRLNLFMLDFPWTPWMWQSNMTGTFAVPVTLFGRVDGTSGMAGAGGIRFDGKASPDAGLQEFTLTVTVETAEDGLYRVTAKLAPRVEVVPEGVEHDGEELDEMAQTAAREQEMKRKVQKHEDKAQSGYTAKMTKTGKAAARGRRQEAKHDAASRRLLKRDQKEQDSPRTYGRGGKLIKRGSRREVKEGVEAIEEMHKAGDTVKVPHKGKMVKGKIVRHDKGGSGKAAQHGGGYVVDVGEYSSITVPHHKIVKEGVEQIDEAGAAKAARLAKAKTRAGREGDVERFERASAVQKRIIARLHKKKGRVGAVSEELVGGQKKLDVNKNKRLDAQDFKMLRAKKKPMKEYTEFMPGIDLQVPAPTEARADKSGKGKRFHKGAIKSVEEAVAKGKKAKKPSPHQGAANVIGKQKSIKSMLQKHDMRW